ncbi:PREDICTED: uncharacterized protein LOC108551336 [Eufriesea mexicana]|uniref:uncharacterized protein LOC108551336 n=1 Tax=Eufriesea mexicana TaxID=516756 RepID=UPI00083C856D|nr:PREDICTED: uncharacterized protein LOC108551336 [Eufriesea mexicana]
MAKRLSPESVIQFVRFSVALTLCWPLRSNSSKNRVYCYKVLQFAHAVNTTIIMSIALHSAYLHLSDFVNVSRIIAVSLGMGQMIITTLICISKHESLQYIIEDMEAYMREAQQYEREVFYKYIAKGHKFYGSCIILMYTTSTIFLLGPTVLPISLPLDIEYPFPVNSTALYVTLYLHQTVITYQCTALLCLGGFGALMLWYTTARFECLAIEFQKSSNVDTMVVCIKKQLLLMRMSQKSWSNRLRNKSICKNWCELLLVNRFGKCEVHLAFGVAYNPTEYCSSGFSYAENVATTIRFIAFGAVAGSTGILILCGMIMILLQAPIAETPLEQVFLAYSLTNFDDPIYLQNSSVIVKVQFIGVIMTVLTEVYMYTWPADHMKDTSENLSRSAYDITWYKQSVRMQKDILNILVYQKPVVISIRCVMPELTLEYFCSYLSNAFSIFASMRTLLMNN